MQTHARSCPQELLLSCCEAACENNVTVEEHTKVWAEDVLPALVTNLAAASAPPDVKFSCLHLLCILVPKLLRLATGKLSHPDTHGHQGIPAQQLLLPSAPQTCTPACMQT